MSFKHLEKDPLKKLEERHPCMTRPLKDEIKRARLMNPKIIKPDVIPKYVLTMAKNSKYICSSYFKLRSHTKYRNTRRFKCRPGPKRGSSSKSKSKRNNRSRRYYRCQCCR